MQYTHDHCRYMDAKSSRLRAVLCIYIHIRRLAQSYPRFVYSHCVGTYSGARLLTGPDQRIMNSTVHIQGSRGGGGWEDSFKESVRTRGVWSMLPLENLGFYIH